MKCQRCGTETNVTIMSMFNKQTICMDCKDREKQRPDYRQAVAADEAAIRQGNFNFKGIGLKPIPEPDPEPDTIIDCRVNNFDDVDRIIRDELGID